MSEEPEVAPVDRLAAALFKEAQPVVQPEQFAMLARCWLDYRSRRHKHQLWPLLMRRFGLDGQPLSKLRDIGNEMGIMPSYVYQLTSMALRYLREPQVSGYLRQYMEGNGPADALALGNQIVARDQPGGCELEDDLPVTEEQYAEWWRQWTQDAKRLPQRLRRAILAWPLAFRQSGTRPAIPRQFVKDGKALTLREFMDAALECPERATDIPGIGTQSYRYLKLLATGSATR